MKNNKNKLKKTNDISTIHSKIDQYFDDLKKISKSTLIELLYEAINTIDDMQNVNRSLTWHPDTRDYNEKLSDRQCVFKSIVFSLENQKNEYRDYYIREDLLRKLRKRQRQRGVYEEEI